MSKKPEYSAKQTEEMMAEMRNPAMRDDIYKWVMAAYPWGCPGTELADVPHPRVWQMEEMKRMSEHIAENKVRVFKGDPPEIYYFAMSSGRGIGKSAFVAMITGWFMSCIWGGSVIISANTDTQLSDFTFGEIGTWRDRAINHYWFDMNQKSMFPQPFFAQALKDINISTKLYSATGKLWQEDNIHAFAGAHNPRGMMVIFDEASGIPENVWGVTAGFFSEISIYRFWLAFSNPRSNTGAFYDRFHNEKHKQWKTRQIDSRTIEAKGHDVKYFQDIVDREGLDSDYTKVEVLGQFPSTGDKQFISRGAVADAVKRRFLNPHDEFQERDAALIIGCDPARFGDDSTVIIFRRGRDAHSIPCIELKKIDNMAVANILAEQINKHHPDAVVIDAGAGAGIIDRLREMKYKVYEANFGSASEKNQYADHRTEMWGDLKDWIPGGQLPDHRQLCDELCIPEYEHTGRENKIKLEAKEKIKKRLGVNGKSPNFADALALTFHIKVARSELRRGGANGPRRRVIQSRNDYEPFS